MNLKKNTITYKPLPLPMPIMINDHHNNSSYPLKHVPPTVARRTLGVFFAPDGSSSTQMNHTVLKAKEFMGKLNSSSLPAKAKWVAIQAIIEPSVTYLLVNTFFTDNEIKPLESILS